MPGPVRVNQDDLEAFFPPEHVRAVFSDDGSGNAGPRLTIACDVATRRAEAILRRAWPGNEQLDALFAEDSAVRWAAASLALVQGVQGKPQWTGPGAPYEGLEKTALKTLDDLAKANTRSRAEANGAGQNPLVKGSISSPEQPQYVFAASKSNPRRGGY